MEADSPHFLLVYDYRFWNPDTQRMEISKAPATLEAIRAGLGVPVIESGRKVPRSQVDPAGRLKAEQ
jgi:hypothetical protein